jgi:hypothetical protein
MASTHLEALTDNDQAVLDEHLATGDTKSWWQLRQSIELLLYLSGEKPATEFTRIIEKPALERFENSTKSGFFQLIELFDLPYEQVTKPLNSELLAVTYECLPDAETQLPPENGPETQYHRAWGEHYGYPRTAISAFVRGNCLRYQVDSTDHQQLYTLAREAGFEDETTRLLSLVSFWPPNTVEGVTQAVRRAIGYRDRLHGLAATLPGKTPRRLVERALADQPTPS